MTKKELQKIKSEFIDYDDMTAYRVVKNPYDGVAKTIFIVRAEWFDFTREELEEHGVDGEHQYCIFITSRDGEENEDDEQIIEEAIDCAGNNSCWFVKEFVTEEEAQDYIKNRAWIGESAEKLECKNAWWCEDCGLKGKG